ncbi:hypothetical protein FNF29_04103 [Cafeteria roenbergensis]|uniref:Replication origin-binding protein domain-containing protein n=1 Tax=Cafeteria roenbergensis TaxID=33653 RepID=A0A5A8CGQ9_CAFRO|nr:hypothetical protein FNF29_04103 [Cafeteria roenbergensis]|eukprot:KAA0151988.1 hypothetical protein FNF29_04103 [Cafeteria roenbergensis]
MPTTRYTERYLDCGFETYRDKYVELSTRKRVICSIESLHRLEDSKYDVLILDEIETILASITSETNYREYDANMKVWENLVKKAKKFFIADAYLTHRTTDFFSRIPGKRIYMVCLSKKQMLSTFAPFLKENGISHLIYHQQSGDKRKRELQNVDEVWTSVQVVLTTPTITIGINQSKTVHFDHRFIYTENISNVAFQKWFQAIIEERLNYSIQVVKNSNEDAINSIKVEHVEYDDIPVLTDDEAMRIKLAQQIGAEEETPQMDIIALRKYRFIEALLGNDGLPTTTDFKPSADLWKHFNQFEVMQALKKFLPATRVSEFEDTLAFIEETTAPPADLESALFGNPEEVPWKYE